MEEKVKIGFVPAQRDPFDEVWAEEMKKRVLKALGSMCEKNKIEYKVKPQMVRINSIYLCNNCKDKIRKNKFFNVNVMPQLKELIKKDWVKNMILEGLEEKN